MYPKYRNVSKYRKCIQIHKKISRYKYNHPNTEIYIQNTFSMYLDTFSLFGYILCRMQYSNWVILEQSKVDGQRQKCLKFMIKRRFMKGHVTIQEKEPKKVSIAHQITAAAVQFIANVKKLYFKKSAFSLPVWKYLTISHLLNSAPAKRASEDCFNQILSFWKNVAKWDIFGDFQTSGRSINFFFLFCGQHLSNYVHEFRYNFFLSFYTKFLPRFCVFFSSPRKINLPKISFFSHRDEKNGFFYPKAEFQKFKSDF